MRPDQVNVNFRVYFIKVFVGLLTLAYMASSQ